MVPDDESVYPVYDDNGRITRVGPIFRRTHLDEIPPLWSNLADDMSVVGLQSVWTQEEWLLELQTQSWR